jgi:hypothetical protein
MVNWGREAFNFEKYFMYLREGKDQGQKVRLREMFPSSLHRPLEALNFQLAQEELALSKKHSLERTRNVIDLFVRTYVGAFHFTNESPQRI